MKPICEKSGKRTEPAFTYPVTSLVAAAIGVVLAACPFLVIGVTLALGFELEGPARFVFIAAWCAAPIGNVVLAIRFRTGVLSSTILATFTAWYVLAVFFLWRASAAFEGGAESMAIAVASVLGALVCGPIVGVVWGSWNRRVW